MRSVVLRVFGLALLTFSLLSAGCGAVGAGELEGTEWVLEGWSVSSLDPAGFETTASFSDGQIGGRAAVNSYGGPYTARADGSFSVGEITQTLMAGSEDAMRAEETYFELLARAREYTLQEDTLALLDENGNELLLFAAK